MLVIVSDLHLSDGSLRPMLPAAAIERFAAKLNEFALATSFRSGGRSRPIGVIDLVLLGDVLDLIHSDEWLSTAARPWHDPHSPEVFDAVSRIVDGVLRHNAPALRILRQLATRHATPVRLHYMVGDRDWLLHLPGAQYDRLRSRVAEVIGLANRSDVSFPHDPAEDEVLSDILRRHRVLARHGDIYDPMHFEQDRNGSSLGDVLSIELLGRFQMEMRRLQDELPCAMFLGLEKLADACPILLAPVWIERVLQDTCNSAAMRSNIHSIWDRLVDRLLESAAIRSRPAWNPLDLVDGLAVSLRFRGRRRNGGPLSGVSGLADYLDCGANWNETYCRHATAEEDFRLCRADHVVYGHTRPIDLDPVGRHAESSRAVRSAYFTAPGEVRQFCPWSAAKAS